MKLETFLVPVDFSAVTNAVYETAAELALRTGAHVVVLKVTEPELDYVGMAPPQPYATAADLVTQSAEASLRVAQEFFAQHSVQVETMHRVGPVVSVILAEAEKRAADLIVLGSHGHGAIYNLLLGSVAEGVIRSSKIPVVVVPDLRAAAEKKSIPS